MSFSAAALAALRSETRDVAIIVQVALSGLTLHLANREVVTGTTVWELALDDVGPQAEPGDFLTSDVALSTFEFRVMPTRLTGQADGETALDLFHQYTWDGATVTVKIWEASLATPAQTFVGRVERHECEDLGMRVWCGQRNDFVVDVPATVVTRKAYPRAPEKSLGAVIPIFYGDGRTVPARDAPGALASLAYGAFNQSLVGVFGIRRAAVKGIVVDLGKGNGIEGKVLFASHKCFLWNDDSAGSTPALATSDRLGEVDPAAGKDFNSAALGTGFTYDDVTSAGVQPFDCFYPVLPLDSQQVASNPGDNARAATDGFNDTSYSLLDYDAGQREIRIPLPDVDPQGLYISSRDVYGWSTTAGATHVRADFVNAGVGGGHTSTLAATAGLDTKTGAGTSIGSGKPVYGWNFGSEGCYLRVYFTGTATGEKCRIYFAGLAIKFRPKWPVIAPAWKIQVPGIQDTRQVNTFDFSVSGWHRSSRHHYSHQPHDVWYPEEEMVTTDGNYYATLEGQPDDGSGIFSGTVDGLLESPPDILNHFLQTYCAQIAGQVETAGSTYGSLVDLRALLTTWRGLPMKLAYAIDERRKASSAIADLMASALCWAFIDPQDDKWKAVAWKASQTTTYDIPLRRDDLVALPRIERHPEHVKNNIELHYSRDAWSRRPIFDVAVRPHESRSGHIYRSLNDEDTTVVASESDRIDFYTGTVGNVTVNLTPAAYTIAGLRAHVDTQMSAGAGIFLQVTWGMLIEAGINDRIPFNDGSSKSATLTAGDYNANPSALAAEAQSKMNALSSNWTVTWSYATGFTFARSSGTKQVNWVTGTGSGTNAALAFGFKLADMTATASSTFIPQAETFLIAVLDADTIKLRWESGANGIDAATPRGAGALLGFDMARDWDNGTSWAQAHSPKNARQTTMQNSVTLYGERPAQVVELPAVFDTDTAREVRNRLVDLVANPPVFGVFLTEKCPNIGRGMVFETHSSIDEWLPYTVPGSDGSWGSKKWLVFNVVKKFQPTMHQEIVALAVS